MGSGSSSEQTEVKAIDSNGQVNNNIIIQEARDTHDQKMLSEKLVIGTYILIGLEVFKIAFCLFSAYRRHMKNHYQKKDDTKA